MAMLDVYPLFDIEPIKGQGPYIYGNDGQKYLDFYGGHAVISIGHSHPKYVKALKDQIDNLVFYSNSIVNRLQNEVIEKIYEVSQIDRDYNLFMINSGAEAIENAMKFASFSNGKNRFIALKDSFHGRTAAAISVTHKMKYRTGFDIDAERTYIDINDSVRLDQELSKEDVCAVIVEPIQGIAGVNVCSEEFLKNISHKTKEAGAIFIADEIQCGFGRSGSFFAHQQAGVSPDIVTMAKGMGNGFPVGGVLVKDHVLKAEYGMAGTTFGGNHLACRAVFAVLEVMKEEQLIENAQIQGEFLKVHLSQLPGIKEVRGKGLMIGVEMEFPVQDLRKRLLLDKRIFTGSSSNPNTLRLLPPLNINEDHCQVLIKALSSTIN